MATPIFVVGKHRSGTTWLANQLCEHSQVVGVRHTQHHGLHESAYFDAIDGRYGDLRVPANYIEFVEIVSLSDYFRLAGATREFLYSLWPTTYADVFQRVMDRFAGDNSANYWVEKSPSHSLLVHRLARLYPTARFIAVRRDVEDVAASSIALAIRRDPSLAEDASWRRRELLRTALSWACYNRILEGFGRRSRRLLWVRYEDLRADMPASMERICQFLGLGFEPQVCDPSFAPNSGYSGRNGREGLSRSERRLARLIAGIGLAIPWSLLREALAYARRGHRRPLPKWFFSMLDVPWRRPDLLPRTITGFEVAAGSPMVQRDG
ncbi:MAG TPA: sulfotransferase [Longimicrobiaceae bacterium]